MRDSRSAIFSDRQWIDKDALTVELQDEAQYAVSRRMLGPEIEGEIAQGGFGHNGLALAAVQRRPLTAVPALSGSSFIARM
jgi:hypothetical protein